MSLNRDTDELWLAKAVPARNGDCQIGQQIKPEPQTGEESLLIADAVTEQLQSLFPIYFAKLRRVEPQQQGIYLFRHNPPLRSSWRVQHATDRRVFRLRSAPVCVPQRSSGSTGAVPARVFHPHAPLLPRSASLRVVPV